MEHESRMIAVSVVMPTTSWTGLFEACARRILEALDRSPVAGEFVVALDGPYVEPPEWLRRGNVTTVATGSRSGPAVARNLAVQKSRGRILLFVDADVVLAHGTLERAVAALEADSTLAGVFGCYDDTPAHPSAISRFRNLLHHHTHASSPGPVGTFWAGCGAIRRDVFLSVGGFLASYGRPSIEDIELGMRATAAGHRIEIDPNLQGKHLKQWTLKSMVVTDIVHRAVPWSELLLSGGPIPAMLNIDWRGRASAACAVAAVLATLAGIAFPWSLAAAAALITAVIGLNWAFIGLCARKGGVALAISCVPLLTLYFCYSTATFVAVAIRRNPWASLLVAYLLAIAIGTFVIGIGGVWAEGTDGDLRTRAAEYGMFRDGMYPHAAIDPPPSGIPRQRSVYPPYAFPMFVPLFEPWGLAQARILVPLLSAAALAAIGLYGSRALSAAGAAWSAVGMFAAAGISINRSTLAQGQFSIFCMGFVALQLMLLQRGRPLLAGACWAMAMLKPHVGIAFAALFLFNRNWRGLLFGIAILAGLSIGALWWTDVQAVKLLGFLAFRINLGFAVEPEGFGPGKLAQWLGWNQRHVQYALVAVVVAGLAAMAASVRRIRVSDLLIPAAICAVLGRVLIYHRPYDQVMLWPLLVACIAVALRIRTAASVAVAGAVAYTLWAPLRVQLLTPFPYELQTAVWIAAAAYLAVRLVASERMNRVSQ